MLEKGWIYNMIKEIKTKLSSFEIFTIFRNEENSFILDSAMDKNKLGRYSFISSNPFKVLKYKDSEENPLNFLQEELRNYKVKNDTNLPFIGGAVGYLSYDLGNYMENSSWHTTKNFQVFQWDQEFLICSSIRSLRISFLELMWDGEQWY